MMATLKRSQSRLSSSLSAAVSRSTCISLFSSGNSTFSSHPSPSSSRHFHDWRSPLSHRATMRSSAVITDRFERHFASLAARNSYEGILTRLKKPGGGDFGKYYSLPALDDPRIDRLPYSIKILLSRQFGTAMSSRLQGKTWRRSLIGKTLHQSKLRSLSNQHEFYFRFTLEFCSRILG
ncbi:hypothetical protein HPP92_027539 [Vanilla planifolia]|uniref:Uncharacterized protein n=1 Tax=Vanilla planifolia TaxID=51239 RepID=A0A835PEM2_VANPL|nr:hypothetical protein HPP92_027539 [Vanilla planifolia]